MEIKDVSKSYKEVKALNHINLEFENGVYGLLGPNGAGKTTLLNIITDNLIENQGQVLFHEQNIHKNSKTYLKQLGYMPQQQSLYDEFTVSEFLYYMAALKNMGKKEARMRVEELLELVNLTDCMQKKMGTLSGGMKQRVLLAQALLDNPKLLILDEPTAGVDPQERIRIRNFISEIAQNRIVILATHIVSDVESIAKEILLLKKGNIIGQGEPYKLIEGIRKHVFEITCTNKQLNKIQKEFVVSNIRHLEEGFAVKIIANEPPKEYIYKETIPNLEDVYLYYFEL